MHYLTRDKEIITYFNYFDYEWLTKISDLQGLIHWQNKRETLNLLQDHSKVEFKVMDVRSLNMNAQILNVQHFNHKNPDEIKSSGILLIKNLSKKQKLYDFQFC